MTNANSENTQSEPSLAYPAAPCLCPPARWALLALGTLCTGLGIAGIILPGLPGTVFLLIALWAFSKSSTRLTLWLFTHPRFGRTVRAWHRDKAIPRPAKVAALSSMALSLAFLVWIAGGPLETAPLVAGGCLALVGGWIATRPEGLAEGVDGA